MVQVAMQYKNPLDLDALLPEEQRQPEVPLFLQPYLSSVKRVARHLKLNPDSPAPKYLYIKYDAPDVSDSLISVLDDSHEYGSKVGNHDSSNNQLVDYLDDVDTEKKQLKGNSKLQLKVKAYMNKLEIPIRMMLPYSNVI